MSSALMLVTAATLGWGTAADLRTIEPNDLLAAAFVAQMSARLDAKLSHEAAAPDAAELEIWYPSVSAQGVLDVARPSTADSRRDARYDLRLPWFRSKP